jgi:hypothetical protein
MESPKDTNDSTIGKKRKKGLPELGLDGFMILAPDFA